MDVAPWHYFLALESDFESTIDFLELDPENFDAFSDRFARLLLAVGSEADVVCRALCRDINPHSSANNIRKYQAEIIGKFPGMHDVEIEIPRYQMTCKPWSDWRVDNQSPRWWKAYNAIKHDRLSAFKEASQTNVLNALCGLMAIHLYRYKDYGHHKLYPYPKLLEFSFPSYIVDNGNGKKLPGA